MEFSELDESLLSEHMNIKSCKCELLQYALLLLLTKWETSNWAKPIDNSLVYCLNSTGIRRHTSKRTEKQNVSFKTYFTYPIRPLNSAPPLSVLWHKAPFLKTISRK